jgi:hypothetical protein
MSNEKGISAKDASNTDLTKRTMKNLTTTQYRFQYHCSFCACELPDDGARFNGIGACPSCDDLAQLWVNSLREHATNYSNSLGVKT